ncbi:MAG: DUF1254 domain-containing protein [Chloroflexota bacterium]
MPALSAAEIQEIATVAYVYGFPLVENYKTLHAYAIAEGNPQFKAPFNVLYNTGRVYTPDDVTVVTPNSDTPYSFVTLDLRAEPMVLRIAPVDEGRYYSWQTFDLYTYLLPYLGSRTTGNGGGAYLFAGPSWSGETPEGIDQVLRFPTELGLTCARTQLFGPDDLPNVLKVQAGYKAMPLSDYLGVAPPPPAPAVDWMPYDPATANGLGFFGLLAFLLQFCPLLPEDRETRDLIARIGVEPGKPFDAGKLPAETQAALLAGIATANTLIDIEVGAVAGSGDLFGSREFLRGRYLDRAAGDRLGIYGNAREEAYYIPYKVDASNQPLDGGKHAYTLRFEKGHLPQVDAFWSVTAYALPSQLLFANPLNRYLINSPMLDSGKLELGPDGSLTLYIQPQSPGADKEANWLPVPAGPFFCVLRNYLPKPSVISGEWTAPAMQAS